MKRRPPDPSYLNLARMTKGKEKRRHIQTFYTQSSDGSLIGTDRTALFFLIGSSRSLQSLLLNMICWQMITTEFHLLSFSNIALMKASSERSTPTNAATRVPRWADYYSLISFVESAMWRSNGTAVPSSDPWHRLLPKQPYPVSTFVNRKVKLPYSTPRHARPRCPLLSSL